MQPNGTVKVKLPLDWEKEGNYKVYRVNDDGTLSLNLTVNAEEKPEDCESTGHISMYAIHISVPAAAFTYEIDGTSSRTSIR